jgi:hypothetical protein
MTVVFSLGIALLLYLGASAADLIRFALFRMLRITDLSNAVFLALGIDKKSARNPAPCDDIRARALAPVDVLTVINPKPYNEKTASPAYF